MKVNERGSTLVLVLIVILVFSVLGVSIMGNAVSERKRVDVTEADAQARVFAQSGLNFFESQFKSFAKPDRVFTMNELETYFEEFNNSGGNLPEEITLNVKWDGFDDIIVTSKGKAGSIVKTLVGHYRLGFNIDKRTEDIADFNGDNTIAANFAFTNVLGLDLLRILGLELVGLPGSDEKYYITPNNTAIVKLSLLLNLLSIDDPGFERYEQTRYVAVREGKLLGANILYENDKSAIGLDLLKITDYKDTNVLINGYTQRGILLGIPLGAHYRDIKFKKFAVFGKTIIQQDRYKMMKVTRDTADRRRFTFDEGLFVSRSLVIGSPSQKTDFSRLMLRGDMVVKENLEISYVDLIVGDIDSVIDEKRAVNLYVHGEVDIHDAYIRIQGKDNKVPEYGFGIFSKGRIKITNYTPSDGEYSTFNGLFYSEKGIDVKTNGKKMVINGGLIGDITVDGVPYNKSNRGELLNGRYKMGHLEYYPKPEYMDKLKHVKLTLKESN